jgi:glycosyltransferase involved in cell wall biosynthesis
MKPIFSVIVPVKKITDLLVFDLIPALKKQSFTNFELLIITDKKHKLSNKPKFIKILSSFPKTGPADKRDLGTKKAQGKILAFIDDDAYPHKNWLKNAVSYFNNPKVAAVCGPGLTPEKNSLKQKASGYVWQSFLGAGGAGIYRNSLGNKRLVDDYPSFNLIVKKNDFDKIGGFDSHYWPGEDTKLCHDLVYVLRKKIIYDPKILVYHHRRPIFKPHLMQISRFGLHRGFFSKILPKTSRKISYFIPLIFVLGLITGPALYWFFKFAGFFLIANSVLFIFQFCLLIYVLLLFITAVWAAIKSGSLLIGLLLIPTIFLSHLVYGIFFALGLLRRDLRQ